MAASVGQLLEILAVPEIAQLYESTILKMQPAELVRRLGTEKVSTRGHMPELRGRLLRVEAMKLRPELEVPWYAEDFGGVVVEEPAVQSRNDDLLNNFFRVARYQETQWRSRLSTTRREEASTDEPRGSSGLEAVLAVMDEALKEHLAGDERRVDEPTLDSAAVETRDKIVDEPYYAIGQPDEEIRNKTDDESEYKFGTRGNISESGSDQLSDSNETIFDSECKFEIRGNIVESESDRSSDSIARIGSAQESFENLDGESTGSWDKGSWSDSSTSSVCTERMYEVD